MQFIKKPIFLIVAVAAVVFVLLLILLPSTSSQKVATPAASTDDNFTFAVIGDTQRFNAGKKNGGLQKAVEGIGRKKAAFGIAMGDLSSSCYGGNKCTNKWKKWKKIVLADIPQIYPVMGNHDQTNHKADTVWRKVFDLPTNGPDDFKEIVYSFDYGNSHFVILNSGTTNSINKEQRDWLEQNLDSNQKENTFVFFHEPAWPASDKIGESLDVHPSERNALWEIFDQHNVTAIFSGHEHMYSRRQITASQFTGADNNIYQFIVGNTNSFRHGKPRRERVDFYFTNKNYAIVQVNGREITVKDYSVGGRLMDEFKFTK
ncbi:MAG: metallophosphoesterase [Candidatus Moraniibacteriota bacterium]